jgi:hypothetical protein
MNTDIGGDDKSSPELLFDNLVWMTSEEAAIYLRKFTEDGQPSVGAIRAAVCRGQLKARKWRRRLYFRKAALDRMLESSQPNGR